MCLVAMAHPVCPPPLQATLDVVMNLQFHYIEKLWQTFWYSTAPSSDGNTTMPNRSDGGDERGGFSVFNEE